MQFRSVLIVLLALAGCQRPAEPSSADGLGTGVNVSQVAPDIVGTDQDGKSFRLSEYRGKVVFLDFWGDW